MGKITNSIAPAIAALVIVLVVLGAALGWRLAAGPVSLSFLTPYLEEALNQGQSDVPVIRLGDTMLTWAGWRRTLDLRARDVVIVDSDGIEIAELPEISIGLSSRALLDARIIPSSIDVLGAQAVIIRRRDGSIGLGFGEASIQGGDNLLLTKVLNELLVPPDAAPTAGNLERISILDSNLTLIDQINGSLWRASAADLVLLRNGQSITGDARLAVDFGARHADVAGTVTYDSVSGSAQINVSFDELFLPDIARQGRALSDLSGIEVPVSGSLQFAVDGNGSLTDVAFKVSGDSGFIDFPEVFAERLSVVWATAHGSFSWSAREVRIDEFAVDVGGTLFTARGVVGLTQQDPDFTGQIQILDLPVERLPTYWPRDFSADARTWVASNIRGGRLEEATIRVDTTKPSNQDVSVPTITVDFSFSDTVVSFMPEIPALSGVSGSGKIADDRLDVTVQSAALNKLDITDASVSLTGLSRATQETAIEFVFRGPLSEVLMLLDSPSLRFASDVGLPPGSIGGVVAARARVTLPITEQGTPLNRVNYAAAANLGDVSGSLPFPPVTFDRGTLSFRLDRNGFDIDGAVFVQDTPVTVQWRQELGGKTDATDATGRYLLRAQIDEAGRERLGVGTSGVVDGFVDVSLDVAAGINGLERAVVDINFLGAAIDVPQLYWRKTKDRPARARAVVIPRSDGSIAIESIEFRADDLVATGRLELDEKASIRTLDLSRLSIGRTDLSVSMRPRSPNGFIIALDGPRLDFSPYLADIFDGSDSELPALELSLRLDEFLIGEGEGLRGVEGKAKFDGTRWADVAMTGRFGVEGKPLELKIEPENQTRKLSIRSADAGSVAQAIGFFDNAVGGELTLLATIDDTKPSSPIKGNVQINEFTLVKAPTLTRILTLASLEGIVELLSGGQGITFSGLEAPFTLKDGELRVTEARAFGPALGLTANGVYKLETDETDFKGTIVPAYTVNSLLGSIPVLGNLLIGGKGEGMFALTYTVRGTAEKTDVQINPLSALAPGFLRRFVTLLDRRPQRTKGDSATKKTDGQ